MANGGIGDSLFGSVGSRTGGLNIFTRSGANPGGCKAGTTADDNFFREIIGGGGGRPKQTPTGPPPAQAPDAGLPALPVPTTPLPVPQPLPPPSIPPFGGGGGVGVTVRIGGSAANDAIFRRVGVSIFGRILGPGAILITAAEILAEKIRRQQQKDQQDILDSQAEDQANRDRRQAKDSPVRAIPPLEIPGRSPLPEIGRPIPPKLPPSDLPGMPRTPEFPIDFPIPLPTPGAPIAPPVIPTPEVPLPQAPPIAPPDAPVFGQPAPIFPTTVPLFPFGDLLPFPGPGVLPGIPNVPIGDIIGDPIGDPVPLTPLTPVGPGSVPFPGGNIETLPTPQPVPQPDPARCRPRKCQDDPDDPRERCFKGLYKEARTSTDFTQWVQIDCETGRETGDDNIIDFPGA